MHGLLGTTGTQGSHLRVLPKEPAKHEHRNLRQPPSIEARQPHRRQTNRLTLVFDAHRIAALEVVDLSETGIDLIIGTDSDRLLERMHKVQLAITFPEPVVRSCIVDGRVRNHPLLAANKARYGIEFVDPAEQVAIQDRRDAIASYIQARRED